MKIRKFREIMSKFMGKKHYYFHKFTKKIRYLSFKITCTVNPCPVEHAVNMILYSNKRFPCRCKVSC